MKLGSCCFRPAAAWPVVELADIIDDEDIIIIIIAACLFEYMRKLDRSLRRAHTHTLAVAGAAANLLLAGRMFAID